MSNLSVPHPNHRNPFPPAGDCYCVAAGLSIAPLADHAAATLRFALRLHALAGQVVDPSGVPLTMRVGVHSGRVLSGLFGVKRARYALLGSTVAQAERMQATGNPGETHISAATHALVAGHRDFEFFCRGAGARGAGGSERSSPTARAGGADSRSASPGAASTEPTYFVRSGWRPGRRGSVDTGTSSREGMSDAVRRARLRSNLGPPFRASVDLPSASQLAPPPLQGALACRAHSTPQPGAAP